MSRTPFLCVLPKYQSDPVWVNDRTRAVYENTGKLRQNYEPLDKAAPLDDAIQRACGIGSHVGKPKVRVGAYLPRVYRPNGPPLRTTRADSRDDAVHAARAVFRRMNDLFRYVEPRTAANFNAFGHEPRNLLLLACTAVESGWRGVLRANGYKRRDPKGKTVKMWNAQQDYIHCYSLLRLGDWSVSIAGRSGMRMMSPFLGWTSAKPLPWYQAYNAAKHDLEGSLRLATVGACVEACAAVAIMIWAQFGAWANAYNSPPLHIMPTVNAREAAATDPFILSTEPTWHPSEYYAPPTLHGDGRTEWREAKHWR